MERNTFKICVTGAAGNIAYSLIPQLVSGHIFGTRTSIHLNLIDLPETAYALKGLILELEDGTYPLLKKVEFGFDPRVMFRDCDLIIFLGGASRQPGQDRRELLNVNANIFKEQGMALNEVGKPDCRCLVVANPCHTNCFILQKFCPNIPRKNFTALSRLDHNRAVGQLASKLGVPMQQVKKVVVWGNHSWSQFPDISHSEINGKKVDQMVSAEYIQNDFITQIQHRAGQVLHQRKKPAVMSGARAIENHLRDWYFGTNSDDWVSMGVISDGSYGIPEGLVCSFPVTCRDSEFEIVKGLNLNDFSKVQVQHAVDELIEERDDTLHEIEA